jgi:hypothetical protein
MNLSGWSEFGRLCEPSEKICSAMEFVKTGLQAVRNRCVWSCRRFDKGTEYDQAGRYRLWIFIH